MFATLPASIFLRASDCIHLVTAIHHDFTEFMTSIITQARRPPRLAWCPSRVRRESYVPVASLASAALIVLSSNALATLARTASTLSTKPGAILAARGSPSERASSMV